jgi:hypothetical protein
MGLDIRWPIGFMFSIVGLLLAGYGLASDAEIYKCSLGININLIWGVVLLIFGAIMITLAKIGSRKAPEDKK